MTAVFWKIKLITKSGCVGLSFSQKTGTVPALCQASKVIYAWVVEMWGIGETVFEGSSDSWADRECSSPRHALCDILKFVVFAVQFLCWVMTCENLCSLEHGHLESTALAIAEMSRTVSSRFVYVGLEAELQFSVSCRSVSRWIQEGGT